MRRSTNNYVFYQDGGWSWSISYIAGLYTIACEVDANITSNKFWQTAFETGDTIKLDHKSSTNMVGTIANPQQSLKEIEVRK